MHFLEKQIRSQRPFILGRVQATVSVLVDKKGKILEIQPGITACRSDTLWTPVPKEFKVMAEGKIVKPSKGNMHLITTETLDPLHMVCEVKDGSWI